MSNFYTLANIGWQPFFQQQLTLEEWDEVVPARIIEHHRSEIVVITTDKTIHVALLSNMPPLVVGDWVLLNKQNQFCRLLERKTCFSRKSVGAKVAKQLISANVDTAFILCSMNDDFNLNRIERFLAVVNEAGAEPVVLLSKSDLAENQDNYIEAAQKMDPLLIVEAIDCRNTHCVNRLSPWMVTGSTISVLGSSGVGKSTLVNTLLGESHQRTSNIRLSDDKGRHTTTQRNLIPLPSGGLILDTPGMREIQLADCTTGISTTFSDIEELANRCRYNNCSHTEEPECAVKNAIASGELDQRRLINYQKLKKEDALNSASLAQRRADDKTLGKFYKRTLKQAKELKGRK